VVHDFLYSASAVIDPSAAVNERYDYEPYGKPTFWSGDYSDTRDETQVTNIFLFTGQMYDPETALYHYKRRALNAVMGRMGQPDPADEGLSRYEYVRSAPHIGVDPDGAECSLAFGDQPTVTRAALQRWYGLGTVWRHYETLTFERYAEVKVAGSIEVKIEAKATPTFLGLSAGKTYTAALSTELAVGATMKSTWERDILQKYRKAGFYPVDRYALTFNVCCDSPEEWKRREWKEDVQQHIRAEYKPQNPWIYKLDVATATNTGCGAPRVESGPADTGGCCSEGHVTWYTIRTSAPIAFRHESTVSFMVVFKGGTWEDNVTGEEFTSGLAAELEVFSQLLASIEEWLPIRPGSLKAVPPPSNKGLP
jgi:RHS repeat-associated protein